MVSIDAALKSIKASASMFVYFLKHPAGMSRYWSDMIKFRKANSREAFAPRVAQGWPFIKDWRNNAGSLSYYFWQDLWAAKKIFQHKPPRHFDIASRIDGFIAHLLTFMPVTLIDIRPLPFEVEGLDFVQANATDMSVIEDNSLESLSSLCAIEHFGLGRYGDPIDPEACFKSMKELQRILAMNGRLYIAVPIGMETIYFNAHRVFEPQTIIGVFPKLKLIDFTVVDCRNHVPRYLEHAAPADYTNEKNDKGFLIGLFEFTK